MPVPPVIVETADYPSAVTIPDDAEAVVATLAGVTSRYPGQTAYPHGFVNMTPDADTTAVTLNIRRGTLTGTIVGTITATLPATPVEQFLEVFGVDPATEVANQTYVLTVTATDASSTSTFGTIVLDCPMF